MCARDEEEAARASAEMDRRRFVVLAVGTVLGGAAVLIATPSRADDPASAGPAISDRLVAFADPQGKTPLRVADIAIGAAPVMAIPLEPGSGTVRDGTRLNRIALLRVDPAALEPAARDRAAEGVLAFSAVCTHEGCFVTGWLANESCLVCPCHSSKFNARSEGEVLGGPAPRSLPSIALKVVDGELAIAGAFSSTPGVKRKSA